MAINWREFKGLIGNGKRKYIERENQKYLFVSYNSELKEITIMKTEDLEKEKRVLRVMPLRYFIKDFSLIGQTNEKPLF